MKAFHLAGLGAGMAAMLACMGSGAMAQRRPVVRPPIDRPERPAVLVPGVILVEEEVDAQKPAEVDKAKDEAAATAEPDKPEPREPYAIGKSYATLPAGCMKLIQGGTSYYNCSGDWYRLKDGAYLAVSAP